MHSPAHQTSAVIVADTLFYPPRRNGFSVRYYPLIVELTSMGYSIDLIVINKYREDYTEHDIEQLENICHSVDIVSADRGNEFIIKRLARRAGNLIQRLMPFGIPYHLIDNNRRYYEKCINNILRKRAIYDTAVGVGVGGINADILLSLDPDIRPRRIICDFVDSAHLLLKRDHRTKAKSPTLLSRLELIKTQSWEQSICNRCACIYISEQDAQTVAGASTAIIPNCVVEDGFNKARRPHLESPNIAFLGNMSYAPNIEASTYLISVILPALRKRIPGIHVYIIGRNPTDELLKYDNDPAIHITGEVDNIWDYIRHADVFVFPMQTGAGLQNKVLEAMYAGKPVVTSPIGNEGIGAKHSRDIYIAQNVKEYVESINDAIFGNDRVGVNAKGFIKNNFSSNSLARRFAALLSTNHT